MVCPKCKKDKAHRSHRSGVKERLASLFGFYPYRCFDCKFRFLRHKYEPENPATSGTEREIKATRRNIRRKRVRREFLMYAAGLLLFLVFLYFLTRERSAPSPEGSLRPNLPHQTIQRPGGENRQRIVADIPPLHYVAVHQMLQQLDRQS
jgi:hypothetical protein